MISKIRSSFRLRLTLLVLLAITIPVVATLSYVSIRGIQSIETTAKRDLETQADILTNAVVTWDERAKLAVLNLSQQPDIVSMNALRQRSSLQSMADIYTEMFLIHTVDSAGDNVARSDSGASVNYADRAWFQGSMDGNELTKQTLISRTIGEPSLAYSSPIRNFEGEIIGAALAVSTLDTLAEGVGKINLGDTGFAYVVDEDGIVLAHPNPAFTSDELVDLSALPPVANVMAKEHGHFEYTDENGVDWFTHLQPLENGWSIVVEQEKAEALANVSQFVLIAMTVSIIVLLMIGVLVWLATGRAIRPISTLTNAATAVAAGNLNETVIIKQTDEIGVLADAFNSMTERLRGLVDNLEQRVSARTRDLELANEIGRNVSEIRDVNQLLSDAVKLIHDEFDLYLVQIYLVEEDEETILLQAAEGQAANRLLSQKHYLAITTASINGTAVSEKQPVVVPNTSTDPQFRPNPLLPDTRSEMAVPMLIADKVIGVLDIQSTIPNALTEENVPAFMAMASQLATAYENAALFNEREKTTNDLETIVSNTAQQAQRLTALNELGTNLASASTLEDVYQIVSSQILSLIEGDRASIALTTDAGDAVEVLALQGEKGAVPTGTIIPFSGTAIGLAIQENHVVRLPKDSPLSTYADSRQFAKQGFQSILIMPLSASGQILGTLNIGSTQAYAFTETDITFVQQVATFLATTIDSMNLIDRVRDLAAIVENHPDFIGIGSLEGQALYINPAGRALIGLPKEYDVTNMTATDLYVEEDGQRLLQEGLPTALETGFWTGIVHLRRADGSTVPVEQTIATNFNTNNEAINFSMTMHDISVRQETEAAQLRLNAQLEERLLQVNSMQRAMSHEGWSAFLTSDKRLVQGFKFNNEQINLISTKDVEQGNVPFVPKRKGEDTKPLEPGTAAAAVEVFGETIGYIGAKNPDGTPLTEEQQNILNAMSQQVADALDKARLFEEMEIAREQMNFLYTGSERVIRAQSINDVLVALVESTSLRRMDTVNFLFFDQPWGDTAPQTMTISAIWEKRSGFTPEQVDAIYEIEQFPSLYNLSKEEPTLFNDVATDERAGPDAKKLAELLGVTSVFYFPLVVGDQWFGLLSAKATNLTKLNGDEIKQITGLVGQAATVSQTQRLFEQTQGRARREQLLREVSAKVYAAPDAETIMKTAVTEVNRIMGTDSFVYLDDLSAEQTTPSNGNPLASEEATTQEG